MIRWVVLEANKGGCAHLASWDKTHEPGFDVVEMIKDGLGDPSTLFLGAVHHDRAKTARDTETGDAQQGLRSLHSLARISVFDRRGFHPLGLEVEENKVNELPPEIDPRDTEYQPRHRHEVAWLLGRGYGLFGYVS